MINFNFPKQEAVDPKLAFIDVWFDKYLDFWIVQEKDRELNQISMEVEYHQLKRVAIQSAKKIQKSESDSLIRIYKKNGELQQKIKSK